MTPSFVLRKLRQDDSHFIIRLLNDPLWLQYIGNRGVYREQDAQAYIQQNLEHFDKYGYGLWVVELALTGPVGLCGLLNRNVFCCPDLGFAFLPEGRGKGLAFESVRHTIERAKNEYGFSFLTAVIDPDNYRSVSLLEKQGFTYYGRYFFPKKRHPVKLFWLDLRST
ncbi:GNAT family N-acetyltransferase [Alteromonas ponticola]|uniref:GNAT family N-acetyltransferase n=1 Tax=Alteromonas aquimaris TaxID=2998417 RepID=A0ABT3P9B6_9ALTE|nr:GNAT family N-acetyltransferase [Alteromonas aquimaris]MCW8109373.1 GNAT family N-acetyltransferase [Alteromonas aquimaris]